jgi:hypothetical protein
MVGWIRFYEPNLPLPLRLKGSGCHYNSILTILGQIRYHSSQCSTLWKYIVYYRLCRTKSIVSWLIATENLWHRWPRICSVSYSPILIPLPWLITRVPWQVPLVEQDLLALPKNLISSLVFNGIVWVSEWLLFTSKWAILQLFPGE